MPRFVWGALSLIRSNSTFCFRGIVWYLIKKLLADNNVRIFLVPRSWILCSGWTIHKKVLKWIPLTISIDIQESHLIKWSSDFALRFILVLKRLLFCPVKRPSYPTGWQCSWCLLNDWFQPNVSVIKLMGCCICCVMGRPPSGFSQSIVFLVVDQSGSGEMIATCWIPNVYVTCNLEQSRITLSQHWSVSPWMWHLVWFLHFAWLSAGFRGNLKVLLE